VLDKEIGFRGGASPSTTAASELNQSVRIPPKESKKNFRKRAFSLVSRYLTGL
jgi:hypothetical protein